MYPKYKTNVRHNLEENNIFYLNGRGDYRKWQYVSGNFMKKQKMYLNLK